MKVLYRHKEVRILQIALLLTLLGKLLVLSSLPPLVLVRPVPGPFSPVSPGVPHLDQLDSVCLEGSDQGVDMASEEAFLVFLFGVAAPDAAGHDVVEGVGEFDEVPEVLGGG